MPELKKPDGDHPEQTPETWAERWGHLLRLARQVAGLSLQDLADRSGLSKGYLSKLESAHPSAANPSRATLAALARALPSTVPLIQKLDVDAGLPTPRSLLREIGQQPGNVLMPRPEEVNIPSHELAEGGVEGLQVSWAGWEILLALMILENSGLGPPTLPVLARACGVETLSSDALAQLEHAGLIRSLMPVRPGEPTRYTQGQASLDTFGIYRPTDFFLRAAISLFSKTGKHEHE